VSSLWGIKRMEFPLLVRKKAFARCCRDGVPHCEGCGIEINARIAIIYEHVISAGLGGEPMLDKPGRTLTAIQPATTRFDHGLLTGYWSDLPGRLFQRERDQHQHHRLDDPQSRGPMTIFLELALSVRQPWAWAILQAGKELENRDWCPANPGLRQRGPVAVYVSKTMTRAYYAEAADFMRQRLGIIGPPANDLPRGGIIGTVVIVGLVRTSPSPWFFGPFGFVLRNPQPTSFRAAAGALGFFKWECS
jgi:hypothetical protein